MSRRVIPRQLEVGDEHSVQGVSEGEGPATDGPHELLQRWHERRRNAASAELWQRVTCGVNRQVSEPLADGAHDRRLGDNAATNNDSIDQSTTHATTERSTASTMRQ
jgi:hypothetical protein